VSDTDQAAVERSTTHSTFVIERTYDASPARVWSAWADPQKKLDWFGPKELKGEHELEFRVGGHERMSVRTPDGALYLFDSRFRDIVEHRRIVHTYEMYRDEQRMSVSVATIELEPTGDDATRLTLTEQGVFLDALDTPAEREHGTREMLDALHAALQAARGSA
jgi:uncharacterized protein YndB with AHSA1/START domain